MPWGLTSTSGLVCASCQDHVLTSPYVACDCTFLFLTFRKSKTNAPLSHILLGDSTSC